MDQSAARNVALEGTEISHDHAKFVAVAAERSKSPEEKELRTDKFIEDGLQNQFFTRKKRLRPQEETLFTNMDHFWPVSAALT